MPANPTEQPNTAFSVGGHRFSYGTALLLLLAVTFLVYANTAGFEFVYDDWLQITRNPQLDSWKNIPQFFLGDVWGFAENAASGSYYRPIFTLWLLLNYKAFGTNPHWWHLTTVLLHLVATYLVYLLGRRLLRSQPAGLVAALLFGLTPLHIENVAWVTDGIDSMMGIFFVGSFLLFLRAKESSRLTAWVGSLVLYTLGLLVKETAVVLPGIVFAYEWSGVGGAEMKSSWRERVKNGFRGALPYLGVTIAYFVVRRLALHALASPEQKQPLGMILKTVPAVLWFDIHQLVLPFRTSEFYGVHFVKTADFSNFVLPLFAVVFTSAMVYLGARKSRLMNFTAWWLVLPLAPSLVGLALFEPYALVHDRQLYLSSIAFYILVAGLVCGIPNRKLLVASVAVIVCAFGIITVVQTRYWADDFHLYSRAVQVAPRNPLPRNHLAYVYVQNGDYKRGLELYHEALALDPQYWRTNISLATTYFQIGQLTEAEKFYERSIALYPGNANQRNASQYYYLGQTRLRMGRIHDAEQPLRTALEINPSGFGYHYALGYVLLQEGKLEEAREQFQADLVLNPDSPARHDVALIDARLSQSHP